MWLGRLLRRQMRKKKAATKTKRSRKVFLEPLEPRLLLSGDPTMQVDPVVEVENNNTPSTATLLPLTEDPAGSGLFLGWGLGTQDPALLNDAWSDPDYWRFEALAGDIVSISVDTPESAVDPYVGIQNGPHGGLRTDENSGPGVDRVIDAASGTFGVRLELPNPGHRLPAGLKCKVIFPDKKR